MRTKSVLGAHSHPRGVDLFSLEVLPELAVVRPHGVDHGQGLGEGGGDEGGLGAAQAEVEF